MKHLKTTTAILAIAFIALTVISCKENKKDSDNIVNHQTEMKDDDHSNMNQKNTATTSIIEAYIQVKNGLVEESKDNAAKGATAMLTAFSKFDMTKLSTEAHKNYMEIYKSAKEHSEHIVKSDIKHQREHFETLSTDINDLIDLLGTEKTLYQDFCPMANNNKGAYWISEIKNIRNPYFGSRMMKCGSVKKQIN
jgi:uncharacterized protein (DUF885 family)